LKQTLQQVVDSGEKLATHPLLDTRPLINTAFGLAGLPVPELLIVDDPENLAATQAGRVKFSLPAIASANLTLLLRGWTPLVGIADLLENVEGGPGSPVENVVFTVGTMGNKNFINENQNTTLRFVSAVFRTIDAVLADEGSYELLGAAADFINSYSGTELSPEDLYTVYSVLDPLSPWESQTKYFEDTGDPRYYKTAYQAFIDVNVEADVVDAGTKPDDGIWAGMIYETLRWYQDETDKILAALEGVELTTEQQDLVAQAKQYYDWHDYLDSFRLAKAAAAG
jgi:hypothetical protein